MKKAIFNILVIIFVIGITGCFLFDECSKKADLGEQNNCYINKAREKEDVSICEKKIEGVEYLDTCYEFIAGDLQDTTICEKIGPRDKISACYRNVAVKKQDELICEQIQDTAAIGECYVYVAEELGARSICNKIPSDEDGRQGTGKGDCLMRVAIKIQDREMCYGIQTEIQKENCLRKIPE